MSRMTQLPVLVLNVAYEPLMIAGQRRALKLVIKGKATVEEAHDEEIRAGIRFPSVIRLCVYKKLPRQTQQLSRKNILMRDRYTCQYCGQKFHAGELTLDHIQPRSRGGLATWENLVAACHSCNRQKGNRTPEEWGTMPLHKPRPLTIHTARWMMRTMGEDDARWRKYLYY